MKHPITNLHDLVELGIKLHRQGVPRGFILTMKVEKHVREQIFSDMLHYNVDYETDKIKSGKDETTFYSFIHLGMKFHLL